jgi:hypothetical protein
MVKEESLLLRSLVLVLASIAIISFDQFIELVSGSTIFLGRDEIFGC